MPLVCPTCNQGVSISDVLERGTSTAPDASRIETSCPHCGAVIWLKVRPGPAETGFIESNHLWHTHSSEPIGGLELEVTDVSIKCKYDGETYEFPVSRDKSDPEPEERTGSEDGK